MKQFVVHVTEKSYAMESVTILCRKKRFISIFKKNLAYCAETYRNLE